MNIQEYFRTKRKFESGNSISHSHQGMHITAHDDSADCDNPDRYGFYITDADNRRINLSLWEAVEAAHWILEKTKGIQPLPLAGEVPNGSE